MINISIFRPSIFFCCIFLLFRKSIFGSNIFLRNWYVRALYMFMIQRRGKTVFLVLLLLLLALRLMKCYTKWNLLLCCQFIFLFYSHIKRIIIIIIIITSMYVVLCVKKIQKMEKRLNSAERILNKKE